MSNEEKTKSETKELIDGYLPISQFLLAFSRKTDFSKEIEGQWGGPIRILCRGLGGKYPEVLMALSTDHLCRLWTLNELDALKMLIEELTRYASAMEKTKNEQEEDKKEQTMNEGLAEKSQSKGLNDCPPLKAAGPPKSAIYWPYSGKRLEYKDYDIVLCGDGHWVMLDGQWEKMGYIKKSQQGHSKRPHDE